MKINEFINESTTSGAIATVAAPMTTQKRSGVGKGVYGNEKPGNLLTGKKTNKKYANSLSESKMKQVAMDLETMQDGNFKQKYGKTKEQIKFSLGDPNMKKPTVHENDGSTKYKVVYFNPKLDRTITKTMTAKNENDIWNHCANKGLEVVSIEKSNKAVSEAQLDEDDLILIPGQGRKLKTGFHSFDPDKADREGETLKNSLRTIARNAKELHSRLENSDQFPEWVSEKIGTIKSMMTNVTEYLISKQEYSESAGVIAGGGVGESQEHFDHEISMAKGEMRSAAKAAKRIYQMLDQRDELMAWQQSYITLASDYLDSVADSMEEEAKGNA
jgi:phage anti-repressor protein